MSKKQDILAAALKLFTIQGARATSTKSIALEAGVGVLGGDVAEDEVEDRLVGDGDVGVGAGQRHGVLPLGFRPGRVIVYSPVTSVPWVTSGLAGSA